MNLCDLKVGDTVIWSPGGWTRNHESDRVETVERQTSTQIIVRGGKFNPESGREKGAPSGYAPRATIRILTDLRACKRIYFAIQNFNTPKTPDAN